MKYAERNYCTSILCCTERSIEDKVLVWCLELRPWFDSSTSRYHEHVTYLNYFQKWKPSSQTNTSFSNIICSNYLCSQTILIKLSLSIFFFKIFADFSSNAPFFFFQKFFLHTFLSLIVWIPIIALTTSKKETKLCTTSNACLHLYELIRHFFLK